jgi:hypothetical protein
MVNGTKFILITSRRIAEHTCNCGSIDIEIEIGCEILVVTCT